MTYSVTMSSRMLAIAGLCVFLLCVLLFLLGIELGKRFAQPPEPAPAVSLGVPAVPGVPAAPGMPTVPTAPQAPTVAAPTVTPPAVTGPAVKH
jgi:hypothetical protein